ncbi:hypothetical protein LSH36_937g00003 [Paralvinella palmiformis]|uniref:Uncharacterized protein n=1 Tax=Paralvinella palmiformis TaxID=53620 RepID=A0AAD9MRA7_9ANNE|nr:hypothetical protein LSH36_937g00003 [Paralvinella palmiformis]
MIRFSKSATICLVLQTFFIGSRTFDWDPESKTFNQINDKNLTSIPTNIPTDAIVVNLRNNAIQDFTSFPRLDLVTDLTLTYNALTAFPDLTNASASLKYLFLGNNNITQISADLLSSLDQLELLQLSNNRLRNLPDVYIPNLRFLHINGNIMSDIPLLPLLGADVRRLDAGQQAISYVGLESLKAMPHLEFLNMDQAGLMEVPPVMEANPMINYLSLMTNNITAIPDDFFLHNQQLAVLSLEFNRIRSIPDVCLSPISTLMLSGNPITCDEKLLSIKVATEMGKLYVDGVTCSHPTSLQGKPIANVTLQEFRGRSQDYQGSHDVLYKLRGPLYFCDKPNIAEVVPNVNKMMCALLCTRSIHCDGWSYEPDTSRPGYGKCGLVMWGSPSAVDTSTFDVFYGK